MPDKPEILSDRQKALEEQFFAKQSEELKRRLRQKREQEETATSLSEVSGITQRDVVARLVALGIRAETWAAVSLVPLVEVAWANGVVEENERRAVLSAAEANGVTPGSAAHEMLESWLLHRPDAGLLQAWGEYIVALSASVAPAQTSALRDEILGRARHVAEAAGGFLGLGNKISPEERIVLEQLEKAFERS